MMAGHQKYHGCLVDGCDGSHRRNGYCEKHSKRLSKYGDPLGGSGYRGIVAAYANDVAADLSVDDCIKWPFCTNKDGYGRITVNMRTIDASRYICELAHGKPPSSTHQSAHSCGNGHNGCVNPKHLSWKTPVENQADRLVHGTHVRGEKNKNAKLSAAQVLEMRSLRKSTKIGDLASRYGIAKQTVSRIARGEAWAWLHGDATSDGCQPPRKIHE